MPRVETLMDHFVTETVKPLMELTGNLMTKELEWKIITRENIV